MCGCLTRCAGLALLLHTLGMYDEHTCNLPAPRSPSPRMHHTFPTRLQPAPRHPAHTLRPLPPAPRTLLTGKSKRSRHRPNRLRCERMSAASCSFSIYIHHRSHQLQPCHPPSLQCNRQRQHIQFCRRRHPPLLDGPHRDRLCIIDGLISSIAILAIGEIVCKIFHADVESSGRD